MEFRLIKKLKDRGRWRIFKLKLIDARLYFVSIFVGLLTGLIAVPYHYLLQFFFNLRHDFFDSHPKWYWYLPLFLLMWDKYKSYHIAYLGQGSYLAGEKDAVDHRRRYSTNTWSYQWKSCV